MVTQGRFWTAEDLTFLLSGRTIRGGLVARGMTRGARRHISSLHAPLPEPLMSSPVKRIPWFQVLKPQRGFSEEALQTGTLTGVLKVHIMAVQRTFQPVDHDFQLHYLLAYRNVGYGYVDFHFGVVDLIGEAIPDYLREVPAARGGGVVNTQK